MESANLPSNAAPLGQLLLKAFRWFDESLRATLVARGWPEMSAAQSMVFAVLDQDGTSTAELARRIGVSRQAVHQTVKDLEALGLVEQVPEPGDGRVRLVRLTTQGRANVAAALGAFIDLEAELARRIGVGHAAGLRRALEAEWGAGGSV